MEVTMSVHHLNSHRYAPLLFTLLVLGLFTWSQESAAKCDNPPCGGGGGGNQNPPEDVVDGYLGSTGPLVPNSPFTRFVPVTVVGS